MNTRSRLTRSCLLKLSKRRHRGFILGTCFVTMTVVMLLCSILLLLSQVDAKTTKRDRALFETKNEIVLAGMDFVMDRIDFLATQEDGTALYPLVGGFREGDYRGRYRLRADYTGLAPEAKPTKLFIMNKAGTAVLLEIELSDAESRTVTLWKTN